MIKYRTGKHDTTIGMVEVVKETAQQLVVRRKKWDGSIFELRIAKNSEWDQYHDTWEDAHAYLLKRAEEHLEIARLALQRAQGEYGNIKSMKKPAEEAANGN